MILKFRFLRYVVKLVIFPYVTVEGVNSKLPDGNHFLMWDFDDVDLDTVIKELEWTMFLYGLPDVHILSSGDDRHYAAFCFKRVPFWLARHIISSTEHLDGNFYKYGVWRKYFTIRFTPKAGRRHKYIMTLKGYAEEDVSIDEIKSFDRYDTKIPQYNHRVVSIPRLLDQDWM